MRLQAVVVVVVAPVGVPLVEKPVVQVQLVVVWLAVVMFEFKGHPVQLPPPVTAVHLFPAAQFEQTFAVVLLPVPQFAASFVYLLQSPVGLQFPVPTPVVDVLMPSAQLPAVQEECVSEQAAPPVDQVPAAHRVLLPCSPWFCINVPPGHDHPAGQEVHDVPVPA